MEQKILDAAAKNRLQINGLPQSARRTLNPLVVHSNPTGPTKIPLVLTNCRSFGGGLSDRSLEILFTSRLQAGSGGQLKRLNARPNRTGSAEAFSAPLVTLVAARTTWPRDL